MNRYNIALTAGRSDFKINFTGSFVYINNEGIPEYTLNSYKEYISINLW